MQHGDFKGLDMTTYNWKSERSTKTYPTLGKFAALFVLFFQTACALLASPSLDVSRHDLRRRHRYRSFAFGKNNYVTIILHAESMKSFRKEPQQRQKPINPRPRYYWTNRTNVERELEEFWIHCGVKLPTKSHKARQRSGPTIPNETLLNYFGRHDLRGAIASIGRDILSEKLSGATIMPGKWKEAVAESKELQFMLKNETYGFSPDCPPLSPQQLKERGTPSAPETTNNNHEKWSHKRGRKPRGYWTLPLVVSELYEYLDDYKARNRRPAVWMPRPSEIEAEGREDLKSAMTRFGGAKRIGRLAGLISFREWNYFEGQYELLVLLKKYLEEYPPPGNNGSADEDSSSKRYQTFPAISEIRRNGYNRLYFLVQYYGGRTLLANRFSMELETQKRTLSDLSLGELNYGDFSIKFAIRLMEFIREEHHKLNPPLKHPVISIPSAGKLQRSGPQGIWLHEKIMEFGGYENVARRINLEF